MLLFDSTSQTQQELPYVNKLKINCDYGIQKYCVVLCNWDKTPANKYFGNEGTLKKHTLELLFYSTLISNKVI